MICVLTDSQQRDLRVLIAGDLLDLSKSDTPFDIKDYVKSIYNLVLESGNDQAAAIDYARLALVHIDQLSTGVDTTIAENLINKNVDFGQLKKDVIKASKDDNLDFITDYLGLNKDLTSEAEELQSQQIQDKQNEIEEQIKKEQEVLDESTQVPSDEPVLTVYDENDKKTILDVFKEYAKPTFNATQDAQFINFTDPTNSGYFVKTQDSDYKNAVIRKILSNLQSAEGVGTSISYPGIEGGIYLSLYTMDDIPESMYYEQDKEYHKKNPDLDKRNFRALVITDVNGNPIYFNEDLDIFGAYSLKSETLPSDAKPVYFRYKKIYDSQVANGKVVSLYKDENQRVDSLARKLKTFAVNQNKSMEELKQEAKRQLLDELQLIYELEKELSKKENKGKFVKTVITGGSTGFPIWNKNVSTRTAALNLSGENFTVNKPAIFNDPQRNIKEGRTTFTTKTTGNNYILLIRDEIRSVPGLQNKLVSLLVDDLNYKSPDGTVKPYKNNVERQEVIKNYINLSKTGISFYANDDGTFTVKINDNKIFSSPKENDKRSADQINQEREKAKEAIISYFNTPRKTFEKTGDTVYPEININQERGTFSDALISNENGKSIISFQNKDYVNDWIIPNTYIHYKTTPDGKIDMLAPYMTFSYVAEDVNNILPAEPGLELQKNTPDTLSSSSLDQDEDPDDFLKKAVELNKNLDQKDQELKAVKEQIKEAKEWYEKSPLNKVVPFKEMFFAINTSNPDSRAQFTIDGLNRALITLYKGSDYSDLYHEAWHVFTQTFLSPKERTALYAETAKQTGTFRSYTGKTVSFKDATTKELEEYLAEKFREYMLTGGKKPVSQKVRNTIFQKILNILKALVSNLTISEIAGDTSSTRLMYDLFEKLRVGNLTDYSFDVKNAEFTNLDKGAISLKKGETISQEDSYYLVRAMDAFLSGYIDAAVKGKREVLRKASTGEADKTFNSGDGTIKYLATSEILKSPEQLKNAYQYIKSKLDRLYNLHVNRLNTITDPIAKARLKYEVDRLEWAIANFGNTENLLENTRAVDGTIRGLIGYHMQKSKILPTEQKDILFDEDVLSETDLLIKGREAYGLAGNEANLKELASQEIINILSSLPKVDENGNPLFIEGTQIIATRKDGSTYTEGIPELEDFDIVWNSLVKNLAGTINPARMYEKLVRLSEVRKDLPIKYLLDKMGPFSTFHKGEYDVWTNFWQAFNKTMIPLEQTTVHINKTKKDQDGNIINLDFEQWQFNIYPGRASTQTARIKRNWDREFANAKTPYIKRDTDKDSPTAYLNYLDINKVLTDFNTNKLKDGRDILKFLRAIGIMLDENNQAILNELGKGTLNINHIYPILRKYQNAGVKITSPSQIFEPNPEMGLSGDESLYNSISDLQSRYSDKWGNFMVSNAEGNAQFEHSLNNSITIITNAINDSETYQELMSLPYMRHLDIRINPFTKVSNTLNSIFDLDPKSPKYGQKRDDPGSPTGKVKLNFKNLSGISILEDGVPDLDVATSSAQADQFSKLIQDFHQTLVTGSPELPRHSDKTTSYSSHASKITTIPNSDRGLYINTIDFFVDRGDVNGIAYSVAEERAFEHVMLPNIWAEYTRIQTMREFKEQIAEREKNLKDGKPVGEPVIYDYDYIQRGSAFVAFSGVLKDTTKLEIFNKVGKQDLMEYLNSPKGLSLKNKIFADVLDYFTKESARVEKMFKGIKDRNGNPIVSKNLINKFAGTLRNMGILSKAQTNPLKQITPYLVKSFVYNTFTSHIESANLFYGDVAQYNMAKEEFHKRNAGMGSTGNIYRADVHSFNYVNSKLGRPYSQKQKVKKINSFDGTINTAVLKDVEIPSAYYKDLVEAMILSEMNKQTGTEAEKRAKAEVKIYGVDGSFNKPAKGSPASAYKKMTEGDGQGWISFDFYRILLSQEGKWSDQQEKLYQDIINNRYVNPQDITTFFPVQKVQYYGPVDTDSLPVNAFHKFSLMPLIPSAIKGTSLEDLHKRMIAQGIDYALFKSGSKVGTITNGTEDSLYQSEDFRATNPIDKPFTINKIHIQFLKNQLETAPKWKSKVIFSTQLRKLVEEGLIENGVPVDFEPSLSLEERINKWDSLSETKKLESEAYSKYKTYEDNINKLTHIKMSQLVEEMNWKIVDGKPQGNLKDLVKFIKKELTRREIADHELDFIDVGFGGDKLKHDLSYLPHADKIEKALMAIVTKRLVKQKVNGEGLIQVSAAGFENKNAWLGARAATKEENEKWGTNDLPFYIQDKSGTKAAKVKIAMQGQFKKLLRLNDKDGIPIGSISRLNALLKDEEWLNMNDHRRMITMVGVRIPVQGLNSMEFMEVYEFLPEESGNMIVLPSEIVAKSGGDFDIDKLSVFMPNIDYKEGEVTISIKKTDEELKEEYDILVKNKINKETLKGLSASDKRMLSRTEFQKADDTLAELLKKFDVNYLEDIKGILLEDGSLPSFETYKLKYQAKFYENEILWNIKDILSMPINFARLITPNGTDIVKPLADELAKEVIDYDPKETTIERSTLTKDELELLGENRSNIQGTRIFEVGYNLYKQMSNNIGKQTLGLGAVDNTYNVLFNRIGAYLNPEYTLRENKVEKVVLKQTIYLDHQTLDTAEGKAISLSHIDDAKSQNRISDVISQLINGWVDIAKDAWIFNIQGNKEITPTLLFMVQAGVPFEDAVLFVSQPIIRDYVNYQRQTKSSFGDMMGTKPSNPNFFREDARRRIFEDPKFNIGIFPWTNQKGFKSYTFKLIGEKIDKKISDFFGDKEKKFDPKKLRKNLTDFYNSRINESSYNYDEEQAAVFLHFLQLEEIAKTVRDVKLRMNPDTAEATSIFDAFNKEMTTNLMKESSRWPKEIINKLQDDTVLSSFFEVRKFQQEIFQDLFIIRNDKDYIDFKRSLASNTETKTKLETVSSELEKTFQIMDNDFVKYLLQNSINNIDINNLQSYKGEPVSDSSMLGTEAERVRFLSIGAFFKDGKLYLNSKVLVDQFKTKEFTKPTVNKPYVLAPVSDNTFTNANEYYRFVLEREYLRSMYVNVSSLKGNPEFDYLLDNNKINNKQAQDESISEYEQRMNTKTFEEFIRNKALENTLNMSYLFKGIKGKNSYSDNLSIIIDKYANPDSKDYSPDLGKYSVIYKFNISREKDSKGKETYINIGFTDSIKDSEEINIYYNQIKDLANPSIKKHPDPKVNKYISDYFKKLSMVSILQSGISGKGQLAFSRIMPQDTYLDLMKEVTKSYKSLDEDHKEMLLNDFFKLFVNNNKFFDPVKKSRFKNYMSELKPFEKSSAKITTLPESDIIENKYGIKFYNSNSITTEDQAEKLLSSNPNYLFVFNGAVGVPANVNKNFIIGDQKIKKTNSNNKIEAPVLNSYFGRSDSFIKDIDGLENPEFVKAVDEFIKELKEKSSDYEAIIWPSNGLGQYMRGKYDTTAIKDKSKKQEILTEFIRKYGYHVMLPQKISPAPKSFLYLSKRLFETFEYLNPGMERLEEGVEVIQKQQVITDKQVEDFIKKCYS